MTEMMITERLMPLSFAGVGMTMHVSICLGSWLVISGWLSLHQLTNISSIAKSSVVDECKTVLCSE